MWTDQFAGGVKADRSMLRLMVGLMVCLIGIGSSSAQPPGTPPPKQVFEQQDEEGKDGLPIRAFMFLSESQNQVMMPGLTWEEFERLSNLDAGMDAARQLFSYQSLEILGASEQERAEMDVSLRLTIEPTLGRWISIPLRMGNFHRLAPPDVSGVDDTFMSLAPDDSGYILFVKADSRSEVLLKMRVSARVETSSAAKTLSFRLPDVPAKVELTSDAQDILGEVVGRGDEAIRTENVAGGETKFIVDSGGGTFALRWGRLARSDDDLPLLEVESRVSVQWDSPQDQPIASVRQTIRNVRGSIDSFQLRLPAGAVVLEPPRLGTSGQMIKLGAATSDRDGEIREVIIPQEERQQRIDLNFQLQLVNNNASATAPLGFRVPEVVGSLRHRGEIEVQTGGDYRLRWRARSWVRSELGESQGDAAVGRTYRFRFDRASFELPLWLGEKERQLRLVSESQIVIRESIAALDMSIELTGQASDGRLQFDDAAWQVNAIEDQETGQPLPSFMEDSHRVIEFNPTGSKEPPPIRIRAEHPLDTDSGDVRFSLPRVMEIDEAGLVQSTTVNIVNSGRTMLVVDLDASTGLSRMMRPAAESESQASVARFQVSTRDAPAVVAGTLIDQPPRIVLTSDATVELDGEQLRTTVDWIISSSLDLEGQLPVRIPGSSLAPAGGSPAITPDVETRSDQSGDDGLSDDADASGVDVVPQSEPWIVTVDGVPAKLRALEGDRYELSSDRLASGSIAVRWRRTRSLRSGLIDGAIESVAMPRPNIADVTVRGAVRVALRGNQQLDLISVDTPRVNELELEALPRDPIRLRLQSKLTAFEELSIRQTVLRTVVGHSTRHEQVLSAIQGGDSFRVGLANSPGEISVEAFIDGRSVPVRREGDTLIVSLPADKSGHAVDLRVWIPTDTPSALAVIEPTLRLPVEADRVYWQIVAPLDGHVIWASPTLGRSMTWRFDRWKLDRKPLHSDVALAQMVDTVARPSPSGNPYLYVGWDLRSFQVIVVSRSVLWICIGSFVLFTAVMLTHFPQLRHPLTAVVAAVMFSGLLAIAPDAAVLAGQFGIIALVLVIVMSAIRVLITPTRSDRVFSSRDSSGSIRQPSTRTLKKPSVASERAGVSTQALPPPSPTEASS